MLIDFFLFSIDFCPQKSLERTTTPFYQYEHNTCVPDTIQSLITDSGLLLQPATRSRLVSNQWSIWFISKSIRTGVIDLLHCRSRVMIVDWRWRKKISNFNLFRFVKLTRGYLIQQVTAKISERSYFRFGLQLFRLSRLSDSWTRDSRTDRNVYVSFMLYKLLLEDKIPCEAQVNLFAEMRGNLMGLNIQ